MDAADSLDAWVAELKRPENAARMTRVADDFATFLNKHADVAQAHDALPPALKANADLARLWGGFQGHYHKQIAGEPALEIAAGMLSIAAAEPALRFALERFRAGYTEVEQFGGLEILAVGGAVSLVLFVATTSFEIKIGDTVIRKQAATPEQIKAAVSWIAPLARVLGL